MYQPGQRGYAPVNRGGYASPQDAGFVQYPKPNQTVMTSNSALRSRPFKPADNNSFSYWSDESIYNQPPMRNSNASESGHWTGNNIYNNPSPACNRNANTAGFLYGNFGSSYYDYDDIGPVPVRPAPYPSEFDDAPSPNRSNYNKQKRDKFKQVSQKLQEPQRRLRRKQKKKIKAMAREVQQPLPKQNKKNLSIKKRKEGFANSTQQPRTHEKTFRGKGKKAHGKSLWPTLPLKITDEEKDTFAFGCESCDRGFPTEKVLNHHYKVHIKCDFDGCPMWSAGKIIKVHKKQVHCEQMAARLSFSNAPEDVLLWVENRKKNWPTKQRTAERVAESAAMEKNFSFFCESCDKSFISQEIQDEHTAAHIPCSVDGCPVFTHPVTMHFHMRRAHRPSPPFCIPLSNEPDDVAKWIEERKKKWPRFKLVVQQVAKPSNGQSGSASRSATKANGAASGVNVETSEAAEKRRKEAAERKMAFQEKMRSMLHGLTLTKREKRELKLLQRQVDCIKDRAMMRKTAARGPQKQVKLVSVGTDPCPELDPPPEAAATTDQVVTVTDQDVTATDQVPTVAVATQEAATDVVEEAVLTQDKPTIAEMEVDCGQAV